MFYYVVYLLGSAEEEASIVFPLSSAYTVRIEDLGQVLPRPYVTQAFICREKSCVVNLSPFCQLQACEHPE